MAHPLSHNNTDRPTIGPNSDSCANEEVIIPINRLPPEILSEIFLLALPQPDLETAEPGSDTWRAQSGHWVYMNFQPQGGPWSFAAVCRFWRETAIYSSVLWSFVNINMSFFCQANLISGLDSDSEREEEEGIRMDDCSPPSFLYVLKTQVERSAGVHIQLTLHNASQYPFTALPTHFPDNSVAQEALRYLSHLSHRLQHLSIPEPLCSFFTEPLPILVHVVYHDLDPWDQTSPPQMGPADKLKHLQLDRLTDSLLNLFPDCWDKLTSLRVNSFFDIHSLLQVMPQLQSNLVTLQLGNFRQSLADLDWMPAVGTFTFPNLKTLIFSYGSDDTNRFLSIIATPALKSFEISSPERLFPEALQTLISRSSCELTSLRILRREGSAKRPRITIRDLLSLLSNLEVTQHLQDMYIDVRMMADKLLDTIIPPITNRTSSNSTGTTFQEKRRVYPNLKRLTLRNMKASPKKLFRFLESLHPSSGLGEDLEFFAMKDTRFDGKLDRLTVGITSRLDTLRDAGISAEVLVSETD